MGHFPRGPLSEFRIARLLLGLQAGLTSGKLRGDFGNSLTPQRWCRQGECFGD
jgi:hypothetical protein